MRCRNCGSAIGPTDPACMSCGQPVAGGAGSADLPPPPPLPASSGSAHPEPPPTHPGVSGSAAVGPSLTEAPAAAGSSPAEDPWAIPAAGETWSVPGVSADPPTQLPAPPPGYQYGSTPVAARRRSGNTYSIVAMVLGAISLVLCPLVAGIAAVVLAGLAWSRNESLATAAIIVALIGLGGGLLLSAVVSIWVVPTL